MVIGPCTDGGYYLVGMHRKVTEIFKNVPWGTDRVLQITAERVRAQGAALELLPVWYDVDRPEDLEFLKTHLDLLAQAGRPGAVSTGRFLKQRNL
ncbi:MAG: DUF2064 domain-containing protein [Nitrospinaceae bacterium]|nr:DUF2064 domain-containing protein [Nitrospinaceae bacterium]